MESTWNRWSKVKYTNIAYKAGRGDRHGDGGGEKERDDVAAFEPAFTRFGKWRAAAPALVIC